MHNTVDSILMNWAQVASVLLFLVMSALILTALWDVSAKRLFNTATQRKTSQLQKIRFEVEPGLAGHDQAQRKISLLRKILSYFANVEIGNRLK